VVGLGEVGLRLALLLRRCGISVVAIDEREEGETVGHAKELGVPVVIGRGADPSLLKRLSLERALALGRRHGRRPGQHRRHAGRTRAGTGAATRPARWRKRQRQRDALTRAARARPRRTPNRRRLSGWARHRVSRRARCRRRRDGPPALRGRRARALPLPGRWLTRIDVGGSRLIPVIESMRVDTRWAASTSGVTEGHREASLEGGLVERITRRRPRNKRWFGCVRVESRDASPCRQIAGCPSAPPRLLPPRCDA